jgi:isocitrate dehydrogenase
LNEPVWRQVKCGQFHYIGTTVLMKNSTSLHLLDSDGIGPELMNLVSEVMAFMPIDVDVIRHKIAFPHGESGVESCLKALYREISDSEGVLLRASIHASLVYRMRREFQLFQKKVPFDFPWVGTRQGSALYRLNNTGSYHASGARQPCGSAVVSYQVDYADVLKLLEDAAENALSFGLPFWSCYKSDAATVEYELWDRAYAEVVNSKNGLHANRLSPDTALSKLVLSPNSIGVLACGDTEGDLISDAMGALLTGGRGYGFSINSGYSRFKTYQTLHGTGKDLVGKDCANPTGILLALCSTLGNDFGFMTASQKLRSTVGKMVADIAPPDSKLEVKSIDFKRALFNELESAF